MVDKYGLPTQKELAFHYTRAGDRTLTPAKRREIIKKAGHRCQECGRKLPAYLLHVHHKKSVASHKTLYNTTIPIITQGKKYKPKYDSEKNLRVLCIKCHNETKKQKKKRNSNQDFLGFKL